MVYLGVRQKSGMLMVCRSRGFQALGMVVLLGWIELVIVAEGGCERSRPECYGCHDKSVVSVYDVELHVVVRFGWRGSWRRNDQQSLLLLPRFRG